MFESFAVCVGCCWMCRYTSKVEYNEGLCGLVPTLAETTPISTDGTSLGNPCPTSGEHDEGPFAIRTPQHQRAPCRTFLTPRLQIHCLLPLLTSTPFPNPAVYQELDGPPPFFSSLSAVHQSLNVLAQTRARKRVAYRWDHPRL